MLDATGVSYTRRDFFKNRFTEGELRDILNSIGLTAHEVLSTRATRYKELGLDTREVSEDELLALMAAEPTLLRRPLVRRGQRGTVGFNKIEIEALIE